MCPDIFSTGLSGAESGNIRVGDSGRGVRAGADRTVRDPRRKAAGAPSLIIGVDSNERRLGMATQLGANVTLNPTRAIRSRRSSA